MIKGDYFLKLLKPLFSILLIGFFGLLGNSFVNAGTTMKVGIAPMYSSIDSNYTIDFLKGGGFLSQYLGQGRPILALRNNVLVWWATNGFPYFYLQSDGFGGVEQGFPDRFFACDEITGEVSTMPGNCTLGETWDYSGDNSYITNLFNGFFSTIVANDYVFYDYVDYRYVGATWNYVQNFMHICWSSHSLGNSLCFKVGRDTGYGNGGNLINSQNLSGMTFSRVSDNWIGKAPGVNGYLGQFEGSTEGSNQGNIDLTYTGDYTYTECTNGSIINYVEDMGISPYMCQGGLDNWDLLTATGIYSPIPGSGKWLDEIYGHTAESGQGAKDWFNYRNTSYINQYVSNPNIWYNQPAVLRSYFKIYNEYGGNNFDFDTIYEYCLMKKFYTRDNQFASQKYNGQFFKKTCSFINNGGWDGYGSSIIGGNPGEDVIGLNWNGVGGLSGSKTYSDPGVFITDMFTKIKSYIPTDKSDIGLGFLPTYIITFMLFLILFRFLSH